MPHADDFRTLAEIAIALAGFTGIVVALNGRSPDGRSPIGGARLRALLLESLGVVFFAFMPSLVDSALQNAALSWQISQLGFALYHLLVLVIFFRSTGLAHVSVRPDWLVTPFGVAILIAQFTTAAGFFSEHTHFVYFLALMFLLFAAAFDFALLLLARRNAA